MQQKMAGRRVATLLVEILASMELLTLERQVCAIADTRMDRLWGTEPTYWGWGQAENKKPFQSSCETRPFGAFFFYK
jgi:hypothetical protein